MRSRMWRAMSRGQTIVVQERPSTRRWWIGAGRTAAKAPGRRLRTARGTTGHARAGGRASGACGVSVLDHQINRHLAFERSDVALTEIVAQFVNLEGRQLKG